MLCTIFATTRNRKLVVRIAFDENTFIPPKAVQKGFADLLHSYCSGQVRSIQAFTRPEILGWGKRNVVFVIEI